MTRMPSPGSDDVRRKPDLELSLALSVLISGFNLSFNTESKTDHETARGATGDGQFCVEQSKSFQRAG